MTQTYKATKQAGVEIFNPTPVVAADDFGKLHKAGVTADKVVWLTKQKLYALPFAIFFGTVRFGIFFNEVRPRISITTLDPKDKINLEEKYYLYEVEEGNYLQINPVEWVSLEPVKVLNCQEFTVKEVLKNYDIYIPQKWKL